MFSFIKKKLGWGQDPVEQTPPAVESPPTPVTPATQPAAVPSPATLPPAVQPSVFQAPAVKQPETPAASVPTAPPVPTPQPASPAAPSAPAVVPPTASAPAPTPAAAPASSGWLSSLKNTLVPRSATPPPTPAPSTQTTPAPSSTSTTISAPTFSPASPLATSPSAASPVEASATEPAAAASERRSWLDKLRHGLRKTGTSITQVFTGTQIDDALYEELESALLMADAGVAATEYLLKDLKQRVKDSKATSPLQVKGLLVDAITELLKPLEKALEVGHYTPTVMMVAGVNGAGKTTTIGKLTRHLADAQQRVLLAAADTFRAAAREQLLVWADRNQVDIVSQDGGDPAAVTFDAVQAGRARGCDVVIADTAGRLATQLHLMDELRKIKRVIAKAMDSAPHEVLLVVDGNTGQNALSQVKAFDEALGLTGLVVTKLDGTAKGGVLAAIALWSRQRQAPVPVYFIGVGEKLEDLQTFSAREFAQALIA